MNVAGQNIIGVVEDCLGLIGENDFDISTAFLDEVAVILNIVNAGELVLVVAEQLAITLKRKNIGIRIYASLVDFVDADQLVTYLIGRIAEHKNNFLCAHSYTLEADGKAVAGQNRENDTDGFSSELGANVGGNILYHGIVALSTCNDRLCD